MERYKKQFKEEENGTIQYVDLKNTDESDQLEFVDVELEDSNDLTISNLSEGVKKKYVIRDGKKILRYYTDNPNKKIKWIDGKVIEVVKSSKEKTNRKKAGLLRAKKLKSKQKQMALKRKKSMKKHTW